MAEKSAPDSGTKNINIMKITNELLAAYAEDNVTKEERNAVRQHLAQNPKELESVMMMMDEFYDINIDQEEVHGNGSIGLSKLNIPDQCYKTAAFTSKLQSDKCIIETLGHVDLGFNQRLSDLLSEVEAIEL